MKGPSFPRMGLGFRWMLVLSLTRSPWPKHWKGSGKHVYLPTLWQGPDDVKSTRKAFWSSIFGPGGFAVSSSRFVCVKVTFLKASTRERTSFKNGHASTSTFDS